MPAVKIPAPLRRYTDDQPTIAVAGDTVRDVLRSLVGKHEKLAVHLYEETGELRGFVNVYVNGKDVRHLDGLGTRVADSDEVRILPSVAGGSLSRDEIRRYGRHLIMPEVGLKGQEKLKRASVLVVGAGGLGSPASLYLAAAGVGRIGLVDFDVVDPSNLQRQVLYGTKDVGRRKLEAAKERLEQTNPHVTVDLHETRLTSENALDILKDYDVVADGTDNFPTRFLVNDACVLLGKPNVYASIFRFEGQASVFDARKGPCYRCVYPQPPPPGLVPSCAEGGVLGVLPGIMGSVQALETVKTILGVGDPLVGRLLVFDALSLEFTELELRKDPKCPVCGTNPTVKELIDYEEFCGLRGEEYVERLGDSYEIDAAALQAKFKRGEKVFLLDVREPHEYEIARIEGSHLIPLGELPERVSEVPLTGEVVAHCKSGARSARAVKLLRDLGYTRVRNLVGGIDAWADEIDPSVPRY
ncbi:MAG: ubiquitin-like small modifier protein 1 [Methanobacteriota archaeon]